MNKFRLLLTLQVACIALVALGLAFLVFKTDYVFVPIGAFLVLCVQTYFLLQYVETTNKRLTTFLDSIRHNDYSGKFELADLGQSFTDLEQQFRDVLHVFQTVRDKNIESIQFLESIFQHVHTGLVAYDKTGAIRVYNSAFNKLTGMYSVADIQQLNRFDPDFVAHLEQLPLHKKSLYKTVIDDEIVQLSVFATSFNLNEEELTLVSIQNIQSELDDNEIDAWQKLIRVLTHEIMNSITPISSLSATLLSLMQQEKLQNEIKDLEISDMRTALESIHSRSKHLSSFVDRYRMVTKIPEPDVQPILVHDVVESVCRLYKELCDEKNIALVCECSSNSLSVMADASLLEQVIINLLKNAVHAVEGKDAGKVKVFAGYDTMSRVVITVEDNGQGILPEVLEKVFVPFYTTKQSGSGVGLSLSRQIIKKHGGSLQLYSEPNVFTKAVIVL